jgi:hypothetical protein
LRSNDDGVFERGGVSLWRTRDVSAPVAQLVADCPRCGAKKITFDVTQEHLLGLKYDWQHHYEAFAICRNCHRSTVFFLVQSGDPEIAIVHEPHRHNTCH